MSGKYITGYRQDATVFRRTRKIGMFEHVGVPFYKAFFSKIFYCFTFTHFSTFKS